LFVAIRDGWHEEHVIVAFQNAPVLHGRVRIEGGEDTTLKEMHIFVKSDI